MFELVTPQVSLKLLNDMGVVIMLLSGLMSESVTFSISLFLFALTTQSLSQQSIVLLIDFRTPVRDGLHPPPSLPSLLGFFMFVKECNIV